MVIEKPATASLLQRISFRPPTAVRWGVYLVLLSVFIAAERYGRLKVIFPFTFAIPVLVATWWDGRKMGYSLSVLSLVPWPLTHPLLDLAFRLLGLVLLVELVGRTAELSKKVRILEGILPICSFCHRIQTSDHHWIYLEEYIPRYSEASLSHRLCDLCEGLHRPDYTRIPTK
jgi:hypothetical protein